MPDSVRGRGLGDMTPFLSDSLVLVAATQHAECTMLPLFSSGASPHCSRYSLFIQHSNVVPYPGMPVDFCCHLVGKKS